MPISVKNLSEMLGKDVFTSRGAYAGRVADMKVNMAKFRIDALMLDVTRGSFLSDLIGKKRGVIVPFQHVDSIGDVVIIKHISSTSLPEEPPKTEETTSPFGSMF